MGAIYTIKNVINGKAYAGQTVSACATRWSQHRSALNNGIHQNNYLQNAWNKYGAENFQFIANIENIADDYLNLFERLLIVYYRYTVGCYNLDSGGNKNKYLSPETVEKMSESRMGSKNHMYGKHHPKEVRERLSEAHKGQIPWNKGKTGVYRPETLREMSEAHKGQTSWNKGKHPSPGTLKKQSEAHKGQIGWNKGKRTPEDVKKKISKTLKGKHPSPEALKHMRGKHRSPKALQHIREGQQRRRTKEKIEKEN